MFIRILRKFLLLMIFIFTLLNKTENRIVSLSIYRSNDNTIVINIIIIIILGEGACWSLRGVGMGATEFEIFFHWKCTKNDIKLLLSAEKPILSCLNSKKLTLKKSIFKI